MALYASLAIMATTIERTWLRRTVIAVCSVIPILVAYARLYRGMHHLSDVIIGAINGLICAALAAYCRCTDAETQPGMLPQIRVGVVPSRAGEGIEV